MRGLARAAVAGMGDMAEGDGGVGGGEVGMEIHWSWPVHGSSDQPWSRGAACRLQDVEERPRARGDHEPSQAFSACWPRGWT